MIKILNVILFFIFIMCIYCISLQKLNEFFDLKFIHIPKNAGTSIENHLKKHNNLNMGFLEWTKNNFNDDKRFKIFKVKGPWINLNNNMIAKNKHCFPWHATPDDLEPDFFSKDDKLFAVVRNPYSKIVSAYKYGNKIKDADHLNSFIKDKLTNFEKNKFWNGCHILPQHYYTHGKKKVDYILKFENLDNDFKQLMIDNNIVTLPLPKNNKSNSNLSVKDLNKESKDLIYEVYKKDFLFFNYPK